MLARNERTKSHSVLTCGENVGCFVSLLFGERTMIPREREGLSELLCGFDIACDFEGNYDTGYVSTNITIMMVLGHGLLKCLRYGIRSV